MENFHYSGIAFRDCPLQEVEKVPIQDIYLSSEISHQNSAVYNYSNFPMKSQENPSMATQHRSPVVNRQNSPIMSQENPPESMAQEYVFQNMQSNTSSPNLPTVSGPKEKPKRVRTVFTGPQLIALEEAFCAGHYLCRPKRILLATKLELKERQVKIWFQNRRMKFKKETKSNPENVENQQFTNRQKLVKISKNQFDASGNTIQQIVEDNHSCEIINNLSPEVTSDSTAPLEKPIFNNKLIADMPQNIDLPKETDELKEYRNRLNQNQFHSSSNGVQSVDELQGFNWQEFHQQPQHQLYPQTQEFQYCSTQNSHLSPYLQPQDQCNAVFNANNNFNQDYNLYMRNSLLMQYSLQYSVQ